MKIQKPNFWKLAKKTISILLGTLTAVMVITGALGLFLAYINPIPWVAQYFPISMSNILWTGAWFNITGEQAFQSVHSWQANALLGSAVSASVIFMGLMIHVQSFSTWWKTIKASPRAIINSPMAAYRKLRAGRDWLIAKVEYLNGESAKWRRTFNIMKSPYSFLRMMGFSPQMAVGLIAVGGTAGTGVVVNETILAERSFANGDAGIYSAPSNLPDEELEKGMAWRKDNPTDNTLRIVVGNTAVETISITDVSINNYTNSTLPSGKTEALLIDGKTVGIDIGELMFDRVTCKSLNVSNVKAHKIVIKDNISDGQSIAQTAGTQRDLRISGGYDMAKELITTGSRFDRLWLDTDTATTTPKVNKLILSNIVTKSGTCELKNLNLGLLTIQYGTFGHDQNFATKEFVVATTTNATLWEVSDNIEVLLTEPATQ